MRVPGRRVSTHHSTVKQLPASLFRLFASARRVELRRATNKRASSPRVLLPRSQSLIDATRMKARSFAAGLEIQLPAMATRARTGRQTAHGHEQVLHLRLAQSRERAHSRCGLCGGASGGHDRPRPPLAHRVNLWRRSNSVAFGAKRTFSEQRLPNRIYEYAPQALLRGSSRAWPARARPVAPRPCGCR
jgi:hypothetical protein